MIQHNATQHNAYNTYLLLDVLLCIIAEYFYELCHMENKIQYNYDYNYDFVELILQQYLIYENLMRLQQRIKAYKNYKQEGICKMTNNRI